MRKFLPNKLSVSVAFAAASLAASAMAQTTSQKEEPVEEIVVSGMRASLQQSLEIKRESTGVVDAIVAEDIGKFPESNVAEALQRIPGVYLQRDGASNEGNRISIRGLGPEFAVTTINGAPVHTTSAGNVGGSTRDFNYDVFPSDLFGSVNVYKTPLADLNEGGIGGVVDLQTPRPFNTPGQQIHYSAIATYNDASEKTKPRASFMYSNTWDNFGALVAVAVADNTNTRSGYETTGSYNTSALGSAGKGPFTFALDYNDPRANLGSYTKSQIDNAYLPRFARAYASENERKRNSEIIALQYKDENLDVGIDALIADLTDNRDEYTFGAAIRNSGVNGNKGMVPINVFVDDNNNLNGTFGNTNYFAESFLYDSETKFHNYNLHADYDLTDTLKLRGQVTHSKSEANYAPNKIAVQATGVTATIDYSKNTDFPTLTSNTDFTKPSSWAGVRPDITYGLNNEDDQDDSAKLSLEWKYDIGGWSGTLKTGANYVESTKTLEKYNGTNIGKTQTLSNGKTFASMSNADIVSYMQSSMPIDPYAQGAPAGFPKTWAAFSRSWIENFLDPDRANKSATKDFSTSFQAEEDVTSYYAETDLRGDVYGHELKINLGLRYSDTTTLIDNYTLQAGKYVPAHKEGGYDNVLPSLSLAYDLRDDLVLRTSWGKTITRAGLIDIAANTVIPNAFNLIATSGNPNLKPQLSTQYDITAEWYFDKGGILSAGAFWKDITDATLKSTPTLVPFSQLGLDDSALGAFYIDPATGKIPPNLPISFTTVYNGKEQKLRGLEFAYQQNFTFLPAPFDGLGAVASYTRVTSDGLTWTSNAGKDYDVWQIPKNGYAVTGFYEKGPFSFRLSYNYKDKKIIDTGKPGNDLERWHSSEGYLDAAIGYKLTEKVEIRLDALNLNNAVPYDYFENPEGKFGSGSSRTDNTKESGRTFMLGVRGSF